MLFHVCALMRVELWCLFLEMVREDIVGFGQARHVLSRC